MKIELSNPATRFLALSAIALTLAVPSRADWTTVHSDGRIVTVPSNLKVGNERDAASTTTTVEPDDYASDAGEAAPSVPVSATYDGPSSARSERVQRNRDRAREQNSRRRNSGRSGPGRSGGYGVSSSYSVYPGYAAPGYSVPGYAYGVPYGYPYGYGGTSVLAPGATVVLPQNPVTVPIGTPQYPWAAPPSFTSIPLGGTTVVTGPIVGGTTTTTTITGPGGTYTYGPTPNGTVYPPAYPQGYPYGYPYGYPQSYSYPNSTSTQSYGGLSISRGGVSVSVGGSTTSTRSTWGNGLYR